MESTFKYKFCDRIDVYALDKYEIEELDKNLTKNEPLFRIYKSNDNKYTISSNPMGIINDILPNKVHIYSADFSGEFMALYINTLHRMGYEIYYNIDREDPDSTWGIVIKFRISKENKEKIRREIEKRKSSVIMKRGF